MSRRTIIITFMVLTAIFSMGIFSNIQKRGQITRFKNLPVKQIDPANIANGSYKGSFCLKRFCYAVEVVVSGGVINDIILLNNSKSEYGVKGAAIKDKIIEAQSLQVDVIAGATISSKSIIKAVEKALTDPE
jgi:uncharacterized protein with FMN-binding domain